MEDAYVGGQEGDVIGVLPEDYLCFPDIIFCYLYLVPYLFLWNRSFPQQPLRNAFLMIHMALPQTITLFFFKRNGDSQSANVKVDVLFKKNFFLTQPAN